MHSSDQSLIHLFHDNIPAIIVSTKKAPTTVYIINLLDKYTWWSNDMRKYTIIIMHVYIYIIRYYHILTNTSKYQHCKQLLTNINKHQYILVYTYIYIYINIIVYIYPILIELGLTQWTRRLATTALIARQPLSPNASSEPRSKARHAETCWVFRSQQIPYS